jgi:hypothetical protein
VIELKPTEAVVADLEPAEDAAAVTGPDRITDRGWDRVRPVDPVGSNGGAVAPEHR